LLRFQGNLAVNRLAVTDRKEFDEVASWKSLAVSRLTLDVEPTVVRIGEILWQEPAIQAVIESDGTVNLSKLAVPPSTEGADKERTGHDESKSAPKQPPPTVTVDQIKLVKAAATFRDLSVEPPVKTGITDFGGTIKGLSSKQLKKANVDLAGRVDKAAPLKIAGKINPLSEDAFTDLVITLGGMDLTPAGPYSGKYAGYGLSKGKLSLDLKYRVSQQLLEAENVVQVDQLTFGQKVESPDATSLPVPLLVALLKDRKGLIEIDLPIRGNLADPDFKYGKVVISTLLNLLGKVVASPFTLLGKLAPGGGSGEDLQFIEFQPGSASLAAEGMKKLETLEQALDERAGLRLEIKGTSDALLDGAALRQRKLTDRLATKKRREGGKPVAPEEITAEEEQQFVEELFADLQAKQAGAGEKTPEGAEAKPPTAEEMKQRVLAEIPITDLELEALARDRGEAVRNRLLESGKLANERVFMLEVGAAEPGHERVRTQLALGAGS
jgi:outer membrane protein OmpA-like peptidoglycan-associated protein